VTEGHKCRQMEEFWSHLQWPLI